MLRNDGSRVDCKRQRRVYRNGSAEETCARRKKKKKRCACGACKCEVQGRALVQFQASPGCSARRREIFGGISAKISARQRSESSRDEGELPEFRSGSRSNILKGRAARCLRPTVGETLEDPSALFAVPDNPLSAMGRINAPPSSFVKQRRRSVTPPGPRLRSLHAKQHRLLSTLSYGTRGR